MSNIRLPEGHVDLFRALRRHLEKHGAHAWIVGGYTRDLLLGHTSGDVDVAVDGDAPELARSFADATGGSWVLLDRETATARIVWPEEVMARAWPRMIDLARLRAPTLEADLRARDFTINALALPLGTAGEIDAAQLIDPLRGMDDLRLGLLRACGPSAIVDDPLRMLRAVRIASQLSLHVAHELDAELRARHALIKQVSAERVRDELLKLLAHPHAGAWVAYLDEVRLLTAIIPELEPARDCDQPVVHFLPVLAHLMEAVVAAEWLIEQLGQMSDVSSQMSEGGRNLPTSDLRPSTPGPRLLPRAVRAIPELTARLPYAERIMARLTEVVDGVPRAALFKLAVLLHDVAKPQTRALKPDGGVSFYDHQSIGAEIAWQVTRRLRLSRAAGEFVRLIVREHMRPGQLNELGPALTARAVYRLFRSTGESSPEVLLHSLCDHVAMKGPHLQAEDWDDHVSWTAKMLETFYEGDQTVRPSPVLRGDDLIRELSLAPGPLIGRLLEEVREAQATGEVQTRAEALEWARRALLVARQGLLVRQQEDEQSTQAQQ